MVRNIVVCCDGTWNTPTQKDRGRVIPSNVVKMARAAVVADTRLLYYDAGVGTGTMDRLTGGAFGIGLTDNIKQAYRYIADTYEDEDDRLFLFGFSRGAYTVRSLAGLIGRCGLTPRGEPSAADRAYDLYRQASGPAGISAADSFKAEQRQPKIHFLGVWDTVGALGVPALSRFGILRRLVRQFLKGSKYAHGFHDQTLGDNVTHAYHALAIDEQRGPFAPALWQSKDGASRENVEQAWFAGVHSNIGGGYVDVGLSDHALMWMVAKARNAGLEIDEMYLAMRIDPNCHGELRDSMSFLYRRLPRHVRGIGLPTTLNERIHRSATKRMEQVTNGYEPPNLVEGLARSADVSEEGMELIEAARGARHEAGWLSRTAAT